VLSPAGRDAASKRQTSGTRELSRVGIQTGEWRLTATELVHRQDRDVRRGW
jgi:hypothetical protein